MTLSDNDIGRIEQILMKAGERPIKDTIALEGKVLTFRIVGTDRDASNAIGALMKEGLNFYSDGDLETFENGSHPNAAIGYQDVTMTLRDAIKVWV